MTNKRHRRSKGQISRNSRGLDRQRQQIAMEAARILAADGQRNYRLAKEKAALRLGADPQRGWPSNSEVEQELRRYQSLYYNNQTKVLEQKRRAALNAMAFFSDFRPKLVGPVLEGTADEHSRISLHVFCENPDEIVAFLLEKNIPFEQETRRIRWHDGSYRDLELAVMEADEQAFELAIMAGASWRQAPPSPIDGKTQQRAGIAEVERLLAAWHV
ncbi:MAG: hypothetical protein AAF446_05260 [Pseudomonadota bacterium]